MKNFINIQFAFLVILASCGQGKYYDSRTIEKLSQENFDIPSSYGFVFMFVKVENKQLGLVDLNKLHTMYINFYNKKYPSFEAFLYNSLNQMIVIEEKYVEQISGKVISIDSVVEKEYNTNDIKFIINKYLEKQGENKYIINVNTFASDKLYNILYYLSINQYEIRRDDYIGEYYIEKKQGI